MIGKKKIKIKKASNFKGRKLKLLCEIWTDLRRESKGQIAKKIFAKDIGHGRTIYEYWNRFLNWIQTKNLCCVSYDHWFYFYLWNICFPSKYWVSIMKYKTEYFFNTNFCTFSFVILGFNLAKVHVAYTFNLW